MKNILISPVGSADPMTQLGDGAMMHICRHYQPDEVHLFFSTLMASYEDNDSRFSRAVKAVCNAEVVPHRMDSDPHLFDEFVTVFKEKINDIIKEVKDSKGCQVLFNITSGTAGMQSALATLAAFADYKNIAIQVTTPRRDINRTYDRENPNDFDYELLWELNPDNPESEFYNDGTNRCVEVAQINFRHLILINNIKALMEKYDYVGAVELMKQLPNETAHKLKLIEGAMYRSALDHVKAVGYFGGTDFKYDSKRDILREYLCMLQLKLWRNEYADFIRALTPAITQVFITILENCGLPVEEYAKSDHSPNSQANAYFLDNEKINKDDTLISALGHQPNAREFVKNEHLRNFIKHYCKDNATKNKVEEIYEFENSDHHLRNALAHNIIKVDESDIKKITGHKPQHILDLLCELVGAKSDLYARINSTVEEISL